MTTPWAAGSNAEKAVVTEMIRALARCEREKIAAAVDLGSACQLLLRLGFTSRQVRLFTDASEETKQWMRRQAQRLA
jgi:hypothetical protein